MHRTISLTLMDWIVNQSCSRAAVFLKANQGEDGESSGFRTSGGWGAVDERSGMSDFQDAEQLGERAFSVSAILQTSV